LQSVFPGEHIEHHGDDGAGHARIFNPQILSRHGIVAFADPIPKGIGDRLVSKVRGEILVPAESGDTILVSSLSDLFAGPSLRE